MRLVGYFLLAGTALGAQPLQVYSEFAQIDSNGRAYAPLEPREILSPLAVRNGFTSLQLAVRVNPGEPFLLQVGQNPAGSFGLTLYREADGRLNPVKLPYKGSSTQTFWIDIWVSRSMPVQRIKVEPQLEVRDSWWVHPMEVRVSSATAPDLEANDLSARTPWGMINVFACGVVSKPETPGPPGLTISAFHARNARQDLSVAMIATAPEHAGYLARPRMEQLRILLGNCEVSNSPSDPERYLDVRDFLLGLPSAN